MTRAAAVFLTALVACTEPAKAPEPSLTIPPTPAWFPARLAVPDYAGASACRECHAAEYAAWKRSPHGRAMSEAGEGGVLGAFDGRRVAVPDGFVTPYREGSRLLMRIEAASSSEAVEVAHVIGSGRQHQVYLDASHEMLPLIWLTVKREWISSERYQRASADSKSEEYWRRSSAFELGCTTCHLSQGRMRVQGDKTVLEWTDLPINCESCHGPGRVHIETRRKGVEDSVYGDLHAVSKEVDVAICAQCHARKNHFFPDLALATIALGAFRADGTQLITGYQTAGHLLSRCYREGAMSCSSCHEPHAQTARDLAGDPAIGADSNRQCTVCHRDRMAARDAERHSHHPARRVSCVDCHMPFTWMMDDPSLSQRVADHAIAIPHPKETLELGLPNACTTCHATRDPQWALDALKRWGAKRALVTRPWVRALDAAKERDQSAAAQLADVLTSTAEAPFVRMSALDATLDVEPTVELVPRLVPFTSDAGAETRALAFRALMRHDAGRTTKWRDLGFADPSALVRVEVLLAAESGDGLERETIERALKDLLELDVLPPIDGFEHVASLVKRPDWSRRILAAAKELPR